MINIEDIYNASNGGLDIILYYYPQASGCVDNKKHFKRRPDEDDASACIKRFGDVYKVTDFGDQGTAMSPVDICMNEENLRFTEAVAVLADRYHVTDELRHSVNKPDISKRPARPDEKEGERFFELEEKFTKDQLLVLGPKVKQADVDALRWHVAKSISFVKNREVITKSTTPSYPIFMRECRVSEPAPGKPDVFYKIYEPLNPEKQWRFSYTPEGGKPKEYINGLDELRESYAKYNEEEERIFRSDPANEDKPFHLKKLDEAIICSGERDSLCVKSLGYFPLWFNSETYKITPEEMKEIYKYVERVYNIPDIDSTGIRKGMELALRFLDIYTIWLPEWLGKFKDRRGKPRKDFRDFAELRPEKKDFQNLMTLAMPAKFWTESYSKRTNKTTYDIDSICLHYFLSLNGFCLLNQGKGEYTLVHREGCVVSRVFPRDILEFLKLFAIERNLPREIRNLIVNSPKCAETAYQIMDIRKLDFCDCDERSQNLYFKNSAFRVTAEKADKIPLQEFHGTVVWDTNLVDHNVTILPSMFDIKQRKDCDGNDRFEIEVLNTDSHFFSYLINSSRIYWRKELEEAWKADDESGEEEAYKAQYRYSIDGPMLSAEERHEQQMNLINKIFTIGYMMHNYKSPSMAWAPFAMDNKIGEVDECNGRSGKSFFFNSLKVFKSVVPLDGRNVRLMENPHVFDQVSSDTNILFADDCSKFFPMERFYDIITGGMSVNKKNKDSYFLEYEDCPKLCFSSNYVPNEFTPSTTGRMIYVVFSDYYHVRAETNDYIEDRTISDDFGGRDIMRGPKYTEEEWNADLNFFIQALQFYLKMAAQRIKIQPPMGNIMKRKSKEDMGALFEDWAYMFFSSESGNTDKFISKAEAFEEFKTFSGAAKHYWTMNRFTKAIKAFANINPDVAELNPKELRNSAGRIIRKVDGKATEMIYLRTFIEGTDEPRALREKAGEEDDKPF